MNQVTAGACFPLKLNQLHVLKEVFLKLNKNITFLNYICGQLCYPLLLSSFVDIIFIPALWWFERNWQSYYKREEMIRFTFSRMLMCDLRWRHFYVFLIASFVQVRGGRHVSTILVAAAEGGGGCCTTCGLKLNCCRSVMRAGGQTARQVRDWALQGALCTSPLYRVYISTHSTVPSVLHWLGLVCTSPRIHTLGKSVLRYCSIVLHFYFHVRLWTSQQSTL